MGRAPGHGRITKDDIKAASLRRWNGRDRVTTDWINLYHEQELCFANGDCLVYLREPGQSSRGPSFRVHISQLVVKGFKCLVDRCQQAQSSHESTECLTNGCKGCGQQTTMRALYLPAPRTADLDATIDHHLGVRNFFAWLYNVPLAGRSLGESLVELRDHLDLYRPTQERKNRVDIVTFADYQRYLDFRECVDHALAAMHFAENCQIEDLWIDAFAHCVGMANRGLRHSLEYPMISRISKIMINKARLEIDLRSDRVSRSVANFFENDLSAAFLGLHQAAREHLDRFRSFLQSFYIEAHGFWPPKDFDDEDTKKTLYIELYSDFRNLYHHLVDPTSSSLMVDNVSHSGGVCTLQNIQAFDARHSYDALPNPLPMIPKPPSIESAKATPGQKFSSLNPIKKRRAEREALDELSMQALIESSNRDWNIMSCLLVRRYSEFERLSVFDGFDKVSLVDGRKVRWILIYAVLQTLITVMQAPKQVRNTEGLGYSLCCHTPKTMPWNVASNGSFDTSSLASSLENGNSASVAAAPNKAKVELTPDVNYSHTNSSSSSLSNPPSKERRQSLPATSTTRTSTSVTRSISRSASIRRLLTRRSTPVEENPMPKLNKAPTFCEIFVQGYGNGLNEATHDAESKGPGNTGTEELPLTPTSSVSTVIVSRESSTASTSSAYSSRSSNATDPSSLETTPDVAKERRMSVKDGKRPASVTVAGSVPPAEKAYDERNELKDVHFNTKTWDAFLDA